VYLDGEKITGLFSLTSDCTLALHAVMNADNKVIYGLQTAKMFVNFSTSHYLYFMYLNTFFEKGSVGFSRPSMRSMAKITMNTSTPDTYPSLSAR